MELQQAIDRFDKAYRRTRSNKELYVAWKTIRAALVESTNSSPNSESAQCFSNRHHVLLRAAGEIRCDVCGHAV